MWRCRRRRRRITTRSRSRQDVCDIHTIYILNFMFILMTRLVMVDVAIGSV
jgi:hypothetical protein